MKRGLIAVLLAGSLLGTGRDCYAIVTGWHIDHSPVLLGQNVTLSADFGPPFFPVQSYTWEMQGVAQNGGLTTWLNLGVNSQGVLISASCVGQLNVRLTVKYMSQMGMPAPGDTVITQSITVVPPDTDVVVAGRDTPTALSPDGSTRVDIQFEMRASGVAIGGMFSGHVQEWLDSWEGYNPVLGVWFPITYNQVWDPPVGQTSTLFYLVSNRIHDRKYSYVSGSWWPLFNNGDDFQRITQRNRLIVKNWYGEDMTYGFPAHNFTEKKSGTSSWILVE